MEDIKRFVHGKGSRKDQHIGILLGVRHGDRVVITGSKVNLVDGDCFDRKFAEKLARDRQDAVVNDNRSNRIAASFKHELYHFENRCRRYFKDVNVFEITELSYFKDVNVFEIPELSY